MMEPRVGLPGSADPASHLSRQALTRRVVARSAGWAAVLALFTVAAAWFLAAWSGGEVERQGRLRFHDFVRAAAASISPKEALIIGADPREPRVLQAVREQLIALRQMDPLLRSVFLLAPDPNPGRSRILIETRGGKGLGAPSESLRLPPGLKLNDLAAGQVVSSAVTDAQGIIALAPVRDTRGRLVAIAGAEMDARPLLASARARRREGILLAVLLSLAIAGTAAYRVRRRLLELERVRSMQAQIAIYRVGDTLARVETEEELVQCALESIATGSAIDCWAIYLREPSGGPLSLFATRGLPAEAKAELAPDPIGRGARSLASRAAWQRDVVITEGAASPEYRFAKGMAGLGVGPTVVSVPLVDRTEAVAVLQCFVARERRLETEELALIRWMATQVSVGLKRIRMERRDQVLALFTMGTGEILLGLDLAGIVTYANAAAERALGSAPGGLVGRPFDSVAILGPEGDPFGLVGALDGGREFAGEVWFLRLNETRFPAEVRISPTYDRKGSLTAMVLVGHDVTERREREVELTSRTDELALLNEQLQRAVGDLEQARSAQSEFVANTSHELRTPLNAVIGFATLIEQRTYQSEDESRDFASRIRRSAEHLLALLNDILDLAKVEAGRFQLSMSRGDLRTPIREAVDAMTPLALGRGLKLLADLPEADLPAHLDVARVRQVVMNLLGNAIKYTDKGEVRIRAHREGATGESRIVVEDTGVGISAEGQRRLFTKFGRVDTSYAGRRAGTGLGLAISKALVQSMGGAITVESGGLGHGTRATITFPPPAPDPDEKDSDLGGRNPAPGGQARGGQRSQVGSRDE